MSPQASISARLMAGIVATAAVSWTVVVAMFHFRPPLTPLTTNFLATMIAVAVGSTLLLGLSAPVYLVSVLSGSAPAPALAMPGFLRRLWDTEFWLWGSAPFLLLPAASWHAGAPTKAPLILAAAAFGAGVAARHMARDVVQAGDAPPPGSPLVVEAAAALRPVTVQRIPPWLARARLKAAQAVLAWPWGLYFTAAFFAGGSLLEPSLGAPVARAFATAGFFCGLGWGLSAPTAIKRHAKWLTTEG